MNSPRPGAQLYTVREFIKTPAGIARSLRRIKEIGYDQVQLSALGPVAPHELRRMLDGEGLGACATHVSFERLQSDLPGLIDEHQILGCQHVGLGSLPAQYHNGEGYAWFAREGSRIARELAAANLTFSYHNHHIELQKCDGRLGLEILFDDSDPEVFFAEIDTYWIQYGGGDPAAWIRRFKGRQPLVHFKDMAVVDRQPVMAEVGEGNLNWPEILKACHEAGVEWYLVEQDWCAGDPFDSLAISLRNLRRLMEESG
jgi:sugar phosphate isomerase/epimerase